MCDRRSAGPFEQTVLLSYILTVTLFRSAIISIFTVREIDEMQVLLIISITYLASDSCFHFNRSFFFFPK